MRKLIIAALVVAIGALVVPTLASASYNITQGQARVYGETAATERYVNDYWDVEVIMTVDARPQGNFNTPWNTLYPGKRHEWVVYWDELTNGEVSAYGHLLITGRDGYDVKYTATPIYGGIRWPDPWWWVKPH